MRVVLSIAGSDSSGGAGIQADLKTFEAFGLFGTTALTVLTAQNTAGVTDIYEVSPAFVKEQIVAVLQDFDVAAIKIGMLYSKEIIEAVKETIKDLEIPIVLDPVFISKAGSPLLKEDAVEAMKTLFPLATVLTPNKYEAQSLFGYTFGQAETEKELLNAATAVVVKNHTTEKDGTKLSLDQLFCNGEKTAFTTPYLETSNLHGTGCSFSSAIAANIALGHELKEAIQRAKSFINAALETAPKIGKGPGPINHKMAGAKLLS